MKNLHLKLKQLRQAKGYSLRKFALLIPMSYQAYSKIEQGITRPDIDRLKTLCGLLGVDLAELLKEELHENIQQIETAESRTEHEIMVLHQKIEELKSLIISLLQK
jgi:transcriptional regulator with XRE-family HTH domain